MKDLLPLTLVTLIKDVLQAIIANELHARMMKSYVAHFRRRQSVTDLAHINSQFCHAQVAWVSRFPVSWRGVGHGLCANSNKNSCTEILDTKAQRIYFAPRQDCWVSTRLWNTRKDGIKLIVMLYELPRSVEAYVAVSRHRGIPILEGTSSGCIDRIDNSILNLYLARTQQHGW